MASVLDVLGPTLEARAAIVGARMDHVIADLRARGASVDVVGAASNERPVGPSYDVIIIGGHSVGPGSRSDLPRLQDDVGIAAGLVGEHGLVVLAIEDDARLAGRLSAPSASPDPDGDFDTDPLIAVRHAMSLEGLEHQRVLLTFTADRGPAFIVSEELDPREAPVYSWRAGIGVAVVESYIVLAARDPVVLPERGSAWLVGAPDRAPAWRPPRELSEKSDTWWFRPTGAAVEVCSGPLCLHPTIAAVAPGQNGEVVLADTISRTGLTSAETVHELEAWWVAASAAIAGSPSDRRQFDVLPRNFIVDEHGAWSFIDQDLTIRFPVPMGVLALRSLHRLIDERLSSWRRAVDVPASATALDLTRQLLAAIGLETSDALVYLYLTFEADVQRRTGQAGGSPLEIRDRLAAFVQPIPSHRTAGGAAPVEGRA